MVLFNVGMNFHEQFLLQLCTGPLLCFDAHLFILFIYDLFNKAVSYLDCTVLKDQMILHNELGTMWKDAVDIILGTITASAWRD
jgi:hypothetical protein